VRLLVLDRLGLLGSQKRKRGIGRHVDGSEYQGEKVERQLSTLHAQA
jgi:hypothetical protein